MRGIVAVLLAVVVVAGCREIQDKATIAGTVTNGGTGQNGAIVLAITGDSLANGESIDYNQVKGTLITGAAGDYKILLVDEGTYIVVAINDKNSNLVFEDSLDEIGYHGHADTLTGLTIPDKITVSEGEDKTGITIDTLYKLP
jgi:uncharacterized protein (DUF2141 family)